MVQIIAGARADLADVELVMYGLRRASGGQDIDVPDPSDAVLQRAVNIATRAKLLPAFVEGVAPRLSAQAREGLMAASRNFKVFTFRTNGQLLEHIGATSAILTKAGVGHVIYKGPLQQQQIYGNMFHRPSMDIDMLVRPEDFRVTARALQQNGFVARQNLSLWWRVFVGQDHFFKPDLPGWSIDLHHRLQEPGVQQPRSSAAFVRAPDTLPLNDVAVPVIRSELVPLVCALNFVKGLSRRQDALADVGHKMSAVHLADLFQLLGRGDPALVDAFLDLAREHRLEGSAVLALRGLQAVFGMAVGRHQTKTSACLAGHDDGLVAAMILAPDIIRSWPSPINILAKSWPGQPAHLARDMGWYAQSEIVRKAFRAGRMLGIFAKPARDTPEL